MYKQQQTADGDGQHTLYGYRTGIPKMMEPRMHNHFVIPPPQDLIFGEMFTPLVLQDTVIMIIQELVVYWVQKFQEHIGVH
ncbi:MAG: hypothetical protein HWD58_10475 [Bacteroidota bacterium]|nr:MAG: hypothetical protein HWD58_10475 [Bacteroidota bacterium]